MGMAHNKKKAETKSKGESMEKKETLYIVGRNIDSFSPCGKQYEGV